MKLTSNTLDVLKNFSNINDTLQFKAGKHLITKSDGNDIRAIARLDQEFPQDFCVRDLSQFISVINLYKEPDLSFEDKYCLVGEGKQHVKYQYTPLKMITDVGYEKMLNFKLPYAEMITFNITGDQISKLLKSSAILSLKSVCIQGNGKEIIVSAYDPKYPSANAVNFELGASSAVFKANYSIDSFKMIQSDYKVTVFESHITKFENDKITYYLASEVV